MTEHDSSHVEHVESPFGVDETVHRLRQVIEAKGARVFSVIDHAAAAESEGLQLRPTHVIIFGSPTAGTPLMVADPLLAIDLPLKLLIWSEQSGATRIGYRRGQILATEHSLGPDAAAVLDAPHAIAAAVVAEAD